MKYNAENIELIMMQSSNNRANSKWKIQRFCSSIAPVIMTLKTRNVVIKKRVVFVKYFENKIAIKSKTIVVPVLTWIARISLSESEI